MFALAHMSHMTHTSRLTRTVTTAVRVPASKYGASTTCSQLSASLVACFGWFVQVKFFEVSESELEKQRSAFSNGQLQIKIEEQDFSMRLMQLFVNYCTCYAKNLVFRTLVMHYPDIAAASQLVWSFYICGIANSWTTLRLKYCE